MRSRRPTTEHTVRIPAETLAECAAHHRAQLAQSGLCARREASTAQPTRSAS